jgi:hypothetical protein
MSITVLLNNPVGQMTTIGSAVAASLFGSGAVSSFDEHLIPASVKSVLQNAKSADRVFDSRDTLKNALKHDNGCVVIEGFVTVHYPACHVELEYSVQGLMMDPESNEVDMLEGLLSSITVTQDSITPVLALERMFAGLVVNRPPRQYVYDDHFIVDVAPLSESPVQHIRWVRKRSQLRDVSDSQAHETIYRSKLTKFGTLIKTVYAVAEPWIDVHIYEGSYQDLHFYALLTDGMSFHRLDFMPPLTPRCEVVMYVSSPDLEYVESLCETCALAVARNHNLLEHDLVELGRPVITGSQLTNSWFLDTVVKDHDDEWQNVHMQVLSEPVRLTWLVPISDSEHHFIQHHGPSPLIQLFIQKNVPWILDPKREPVA